MADEKYLNLNGLQYFLRKLDEKKADLESPDFTGTPTAPTADQDTNTTQIATTEFVQNALNNEILNPLYGKTILTFGDSISYGVGYAGGYGKTIADKYGATLINQGLDGGTLANGVAADSGSSATRPCISDAIKEYTNYDNIDYIILEGGINDAWAGSNAVALGSISDTDSYNITTIIGGLESALSFLRKNYSQKKIIFVFPHAGMLDLSHYWHTSVKPSLKQALIKWGVPFVDIQYSSPLIGPYGVSGLKNLYLSDNTHPNQLGYETFYTTQIADLLMRLNVTNMYYENLSQSSEESLNIHNISNFKIDQLFMEEE